MEHKDIVRRLVVYRTMSGTRIGRVIEVNYLSDEFTVRTNDDKGRSVEAKVRISDVVKVIENVWK